ncbi:hypothetical protein INT45_007432, partial [Circinella minor]
MLTKSALDASALKGYQQLHFFTNKLHADGIYILTEIASIKAPTCLEDFDTYSHYLDDLAAVFNFYKDNCIPLPRDKTRTLYMKRRPTLHDEEL